MYNDHFKILIVYFSCRILTPEQRNYKNGLVVFNVKDKDMFGMSNQYLAEAFLHFSEIPDTSEDIRGLPQVHLMLSRPTKLGKILSISIILIHLNMYLI